MRWMSLNSEGIKHASGAAIKSSFDCVTEGYTMYPSDRHNSPCVWRVDIGSLL